MFGHEKFGAYKKSIEFVAESFKIIGYLPKGNADLVDQFKRASISIPLNIAEGSGKSSALDKKRFYKIARGSTMECAAILEILQILFELPSERMERARSLLEEVASIVTKVCNS